MSLRSFEDVVVGDELPAKTVTLTRGNLVNYAGVSGDPNPIHWSDKVAEWLGDPGAVKEYNVRFTSPVYVEADEAAAIEFNGKIKSLDPESKTAVVAIVAKSEGRKIFGRATATVRLA